VDQQPLQNIGVATEMYATHAARLKEMGEGPFQSLTSQSQQAQTSGATNAPTIAVHGVLADEAGRQLDVQSYTLDAAGLHHLKFRG
jgi:hypothetical protein